MNELKEYTKKTTKDIVIFAVFAVVFLVATIVLFNKHSFILFIVMGLCSMVLFIAALTSSSKDKKFYDEIENSKDRNEILNDFKYAKSCANDGIRMGDKYIYTKKQAYLINYKDIKKLQYFEHYDMEGANLEVGISIDLVDGTIRTLCNLYGNDYQLQKEEIYNLILSKNPNIEIIM